MFDIRLIREKPASVRKNLKRRNEPEVLERLEKAITKDQKWRASLQRIEKLRKQRNEITERIAQLKRQGKPFRKEMAAVKDLPERIRKLDEKNQKDPNVIGSEPMYWTYEYGKGRVFCCILGHYVWTYDDPYYELLLLRGMAWAAGEWVHRFDPVVAESIESRAR